ncbi:MAG: exodeoxyribonuclease V subunit alpha [Thermodesulfobacteriota bacterium]
MTTPMHAVALAGLVEEGHLAPVDPFFVRTLQRLDPAADPAALLAGALARRAIDHGHVCLDLDRLDPALASALAVLPFWPAAPAAMLAQLAASRLVGDGTVPTPLVLTGRRLYLYRYWRYEQELAAAIRTRTAAVTATPDEVAAALLDRLLADGAMTMSHEQRRAVLMAATRRLAVISGGPGTGKTTIVLALMALTQELAKANNGAFGRILLLAPTGKAAARLAQAVQERVADLRLDEALRAALPREAATIHRALGYQPRTPTTFRHGPANPLPAEVVVVDEASMVDLALMAKLFRAVAPTAALVLLGDKDQLASVEAGSLMGDLCFAATAGDGATPLAGSVAELTTSFRFAAEAGVGALVGRIKAGDSEGMLVRLDGRDADSRLYAAPLPLSRNEPLRRLIVEGYRPSLTATDPGEALARLADFRLLCALRRGPFGVGALNGLCERVLAEAGLLRPQGEWYQGRPLMVTANHYGLRLFNGDLGVLWPDGSGTLHAWFLDPASGRLRSVPTARLPGHETAFAMTVHKSQGSEFTRVVVLLPEEVSPVLTRELLYTAVSRARKAVAIFGTPEILRQAVAQRVVRRSGLRQRLVAGEGRGTTAS